MKKILMTALTGALLCTGASSFAASHTAAPAAGPAGGMMAKDMNHGHDMSKKDMMKDMDANSDGLISKEEFMKHHEKMFDAMPKNKDGLVDMKSMHMGDKKK